MTTASPTWSPRLDTTFRDEWLTYLVMHPGEWCHATDLYRCDDVWQRHVLQEVAYETVQAARRLGYVIDGDRRLGYRYQRSVVVRYVHVREGGDGADPGQLTLAAVLA